MAEHPIQHNVLWYEIKVSQKWNENKIIYVHQLKLKGAWVNLRGYTDTGTVRFLS